MEGIKSLSSSSSVGSQINGEDAGDDFYEKIEAPKFVDLTAPDNHRPADDDRYWFCLRVGCDQKHEEELDSEAIYKNFVLRVIAARSPSVRLRKAFHKRDPSTNMKCPLTVPAKSSKSRVSKLAMISSIPQKMVNGKVKGKPISKQTATPKAEKKQSSIVAKALTTPSNKKLLSNPGTFRSVRNPMATPLSVTKNKVVAKALVFNSPKKKDRTKASLELSAPLRTICAGMKKLAIVKEKENVPGKNKTSVLDGSRKQLRSRMVKSRVYDSHPLDPKANEAKSSKCLEKKRKEKDLQVHHGPTSIEETENDSSDMEVEEKSRNCSLEMNSASGPSKTDEESANGELLKTVEVLKLPLDEIKVEACSDATRSDITSESNSEERSNSGENDVQNVTEDRRGEGNQFDEGCDYEKKIKLSPEKREVPEKLNRDSDDKENMKNNFMENTSPSDNKRELNINSNSQVEKEKILGKQKLHKNSQKVTGIMNKTSKEISGSAAPGAQGVKYRKPKLTNPKPFRLRTDERGILKEANLDKKHNLSGVLEANWQRKHQNLAEGSDLQEGSEKGDRTRNNQLNRVGTTCLKTSKGAAEQNSSAIPHRRAVTAHQNAKFVVNDATPKCENSFKRSKSPFMRNPTRPQGIASSRKKIGLITKPVQLSVIKETSPAIMRPKQVGKLIENGASPATEASGSAAITPLSRGRRRTTIPKEPNFHSIHVPKSCTRRV